MTPVPVRLGDLDAAARALRAAPRRRWAWLATRMLAEAGRGAAHLAMRGRPHPRYGDGSLMAAALRRHPETAPPLREARYRDALRSVLDALDNAYPEAQETQSGVVGSRRRRPSGMPSPQSSQIPKSP